MKPDRRVPLTKEAICADIKEYFLGNKGMKTLAIIYIVGLSVPIAIFVPVFGIILLGFTLLILGSIFYSSVYARIVLRRFSIAIDLYPSPLVEMNFQSGGRGSKTQLALRFPRDTWVTPDRAYTWRGPDAMRAEDMYQRFSAGETFFLVRDTKGRLLYAYNTNTFTVSEELAPYVKDFRQTPEYRKKMKRWKRGFFSRYK